MDQEVYSLRFYFALKTIERIFSGMELNIISTMVSAGMMLSGISHLHFKEQEENYEKALTVLASERYISNSIYFTEYLCKIY